ncbi:MAG: hypothetical protein H7101_08710 [Deinococcales bacterium]|nr:hypothetical protein [Chitinophagaceae bacterium]
MFTTNHKTTLLGKQVNTGDKNNKSGYPLYPVSDDIFNHAIQETEIDPENITAFKKDTHSQTNNLDIPGSELDDNNEAIGEEDEENNYYSIGGDNHNNLEENT